MSYKPSRYHRDGFFIGIPLFPIPYSFILIPYPFILIPYSFPLFPYFTIFQANSIEMDKIQDLISYLEQIAPPMYQESYDNSGLIVGDASQNITGVMLCLDSTEAVLDEAIEKGCNVIVAHHPIVFRGLKTFTGRNYVERVVIKAIQNNLAIYACHTNLDNVAQGVNARICKQIGLSNTRILSPKSVVQSMGFSVPVDQESKIWTMLRDLIEGYPEALSSTLGLGLDAKTHQAQMHYSLQLPQHLIQIASNRLKASGIKYKSHSIDQRAPEVGSGMIGELKKPADPLSFLKKVKKTMRCGCVRHTELLDQPIRKVAVCGGSGGFLLPQAIRAGAQLFITADYKYHEFFDADQQIIIADIGHYESEQYTIQLFEDLIIEKFSNFAVHLTSINTNPVNYI